MKKFFFIFLTSFLSTLGMAQNNEFKSVDNAEFAKTIANKQVQIVDVRTPAEYKSGHIPDAINIDLKSSDFDAKAGTLDKGRPVAIYCRSGARSKIAARKLSEKGYQVIELDRGITNWDGKTTH
ncbi:MAG: rhodanese-like domain-containing protein [Bacteroidales bacterium]